MDHFSSTSHHKWPNPSWPLSCRQEFCAPKTRLVQKCLTMPFSSHPGWIPTDRNHFSCCCKAICAVAEEIRICAKKRWMEWVRKPGGTQGTVKTCLIEETLGWVGLMFTHLFQQKTQLIFLFEVFQEFTNESRYTCTPPHTYRNTDNYMHRQKERVPRLTCCMLLLPCDLQAHNLQKKGFNQCLRQKIWNLNSWP